MDPQARRLRRSIRLCILFLLILLTANKVLTATLNDSNDLKLTLSEKQALDNFKKEVTGSLTEDFMKTDFYLIRWLRKANLNIPAAKRLLLETALWRKTNNVSQILSTDWTDMVDEFPITFHGHDKSGRPVMTMEVGDWDVRAALLQGRGQRIRRYMIYADESLMQSILKVQQETGKPVTRAIVLADSGGLNLHQQMCPMCMPYFFEWTVSREVHFPEFVKELIMINVPSMAVVAFNTVRPSLSPSMANGITLFDSNKRVWEGYLDKIIDRSQRSARYGGSRND